MYLEFQKKRKKTGKEIRKIKKQVLQYVRRNIKQVEELAGKIRPVDILDWAVIEGIKKRMKDVRPIVRGKAGKDVEFGPKCSVSYVDGYLFLDKISFEAYHEGNVLNESMSEHKRRFLSEAKIITADKIYGTRSNRQMLEEKGIKASLVPLGRKSKLSDKKEKWIKKKQRERNRIEGAIGNSKTTYGLERLRYKIMGGEEINIRLGLVAMNLTAMLAKI